MTNRLETADLVLTTAHKAKGLEFDTVKLSEDFLQGLDRVDALSLRSCEEDEKNLLYVAVSRFASRPKIAVSLSFNRFGAFTDKRSASFQGEEVSHHERDACKFASAVRGAVRNDSAKPPFLNALGRFGCPGAARG